MLEDDSSTFGQVKAIFTELCEKTNENIGIFVVISNVFTDLIDGLLIVMISVDDLVGDLFEVCLYVFVGVLGEDIMIPFGRERVIYSEGGVFVVEVGVTGEEDVF